METEGSLTVAQHEIMDAIWNATDAGATVTDVWEAISPNRDITRSTILNQMDRLEKRGWLRRSKHGRPSRHFAVLSREETARSLASEFVDGFFGGSASNLVMSLLGTGKLSPEEVSQLRSLLNSKRQGGQP